MAFRRRGKKRRSRRRGGFKRRGRAGKRRVKNPFAKRVGRRL